MDQLALVHVLKENTKEIVIKLAKLAIVIVLHVFLLMDLQHVKVVTMAIFYRLIHV